MCADAVREVSRHKIALLLPHIKACAAVSNLLAVLHFVMGVCEWCLVVVRCVPWDCYEGGTLCILWGFILCWSHMCVCVTWVLTWGGCDAVVEAWSVVFCCCCCGNFSKRGPLTAPQRLMQGGVG